MNTHRYVTGMIAIALIGSSIASGQEKKPVVVAPPVAKPAAAAKRVTPAASQGAAGHGGSAVSRGAAATGHVPNVASPRPNNTSRGPSTNGAGHSGAAVNPVARPGAGTAAGGAGSRGLRAGNSGGVASAAGSRTVRTTNGSSVVTRADGRRAEVHDAQRNMDIHHGLNGNRRVAVERTDRSRVVSERGGRGYVQRPYMYRGSEYGHRTYYSGGRAYDRFYRGYAYHGVYVYGYAPSFYYAPAFYGWAYNPWYAPVQYSWGFGGSPWYGYYGSYYTPYPVYPSASVWLADYIISQSLAASYAAHQGAGQQQQQQQQQPQQQQAAMAPDAAPLTPQVKDMIAEEVKRQIALENQEAQQTAANTQPDPASSGIARMMSDNIQHVFVAGADLDVIDAGGTECAVSQGDALQLAHAPAPEETAADLLVLSSKGGQECKKGATVSIALADLQDMQNHMRETIDQGMSDLQAKGGQGGLPAVPAAAKAAPVKAAFAAAAPPADQNARLEIALQSAEADKAEQEVAGQAGDASGPSATGGQAAVPVAGAQASTAQAGPATISLGLSVEEVTGILGPPKTIVELGAKKIYVYRDMKIIFKSGKVADVQ